MKSMKNKKKHLAPGLPAWFMAAALTVMAAAMITGCSAGIKAAQEGQTAAQSTAAQSTAAQSTAAQEGETAKMVKPFRDYDSIEEARSDYGIDFNVPGWVPDGFEPVIFSVWNDKSMAQVYYTKGDDSMVFRVSSTLTPKEINGDYSVYDTERVCTVGELSVTCIGNGDMVFNAMWEADGVSCCLLSAVPLTFDEMKQIVESIV